MNNFEIQPNASRPAIRADWEAGIVSMRGDSYPENSFELFQPLIEWVTQYLNTAGRPLHLELELVYINTSSIRAMMDIFDLMETAHQQGVQTSVRWTYEAANERVGELAGEFREDCTFPFEITSK